VVQETTQCHVHQHNDRCVQVNVHQCQVHVQDLFVQVLLQDHNKVVQQLAHQQAVVVQPDKADKAVPVVQQLAHQIQILHIAHRMQTLVAHQQHLVVQVVQVGQVVQVVKAVDVINVAELLVHLESKAENLARRIRVRKRYVKSSTIWRRLHLVAQLFHTVMANQQFAYVAAQHLWISQKKSVAIQQR
jgi:hypothetical protein